MTENLTGFIAAKMHKNEYERCLEAFDEKGEKTIEVNYHGRYALPKDEFTMLVAEIVLAYFKIGDNGVPVYAPDEGKIAQRLLTIRYYTDIELPEDPDEAYNLCYACGVYDEITEWCSQTQLMDIETTVSEYEDYILSVMENAAASELLDGANAIAAGIEEFLDNANEKAADVLTSDIVKQISDVFYNITGFVGEGDKKIGADDAKAFIETIAEASSKSKEVK